MSDRGSRLAVYTDAANHPQQENQQPATITPLAAIRARKRISGPVHPIRKALKPGEILQLAKIDNRVFALPALDNTKPGTIRIDLTKQSKFATDELGGSKEFFQAGFERADVLLQYCPKLVEQAEALQLVVANASLQDFARTIRRGLGPGHELIRTRLCRSLDYALTEAWLTEFLSKFKNTKTLMLQGFPALDILSVAIQSGFKIENLVIDPSVQTWFDKSPSPFRDVFKPGDGGRMSEEEDAFFSNLRSFKLNWRVDFAAVVGPVFHLACESQEDSQKMLKKVVKMSSNLKHLTLVGFQPSGTWPMLESNSLECLEIEDAVITGAELRMLMKLPTLKRVSLEGVFLTKGTWEKVLEARPKQLSKLQLGHNIGYMQSEPGECMWSHKPMTLYRVFKKTPTSSRSD